MRDMARGALFHDYFFYDAQDGDPAHKKHWSRHPDIAWRNASKELDLTGIETYHQTLIMITHNLEVAQMADRVLRMEDGRLKA